MLPNWYLISSPTMIMSPASCSAHHHLRLIDSDPAAVCQKPSPDLTPTIQTPSVVKGSCTEIAQLTIGLGLYLIKTHGWWTQSFRCIGQKHLYLILLLWPSHRDQIMSAVRLLKTLFSHEAGNTRPSVKVSWGDTKKNAHPQQQSLVPLRL